MKLKYLFLLSTTSLFGTLSMMGEDIINEETVPVEEEQLQEEIVNDTIFYKDPHAVFEDITQVDFANPVVNRSFVPKVFAGYRNIDKKWPGFKSIEFMRIIEPADTVSEIFYEDQIEEILEGIESENQIFLTPDTLSLIPVPSPTEYLDESVLNPERLPKWLTDALITNKLEEDLLYSYMIENPSKIEYAFWDLPEPPQLMPDDVTFKGYLRKLKLPEIDMEKAVLPEENLKKIYWLHTFNTLLQFSQAYVSPNWYQGGNNYLALLFNINWNVQLNQVYHPNLLFQSNFSYKLALSSNPKGQLHKYTISEDLLQYNLNAGVKAYKNWFYSFNLLFKTQLLNNYEEDSYVRTASFLSPGDLNMGLGMSYSRQNKYKTFQFTATISPLSYNLKTCISNKIDHEQFNISPYKKVKNEIGSNAEFNMSWDITSNISYKTRMFLFSDYSYFLGDWENTLSFSINKFLSTQIYVHLRYDTSAEKYESWKNFMMREILSFGLSYTFSTKP